MAASKAGSKVIQKAMSHWYCILELAVQVGCGGKEERIVPLIITSLCHLYRKLITGGGGQRGEGGGEENALVKTFPWRFYTV